MEAYLQQEKIMNMLRQPIPGKRVDLIRLQVVRESTGLYGISRFTEPQEAADMVRPLISAADRELFLVMSVNTRMEPMAVEIVSVGTLNACLVEMRDCMFPQSSVRRRRAKPGRQAHDRKAGSCG